MTTTGAARTGAASNQLRKALLANAGTERLYMTRVSFVTIRTGECVRCSVDYIPIAVREFETSGQCVICNPERFRELGLQAIDGDGPIGEGSA